MKKQYPIFSIWPNVILTGCICLTFAALSLFARYDYQTDAKNHTAEVSRLKLEEVRDRLDLLSDLLVAHSALLAETGDTQWVASYQEDIGEWTKIMDYNPRIKKTVSPIVDSLFLIESSVIVAAQKNDLAQAKRLIADPSYHRNEEALDKKLDEIKIQESNLEKNSSEATAAANARRLYYLWAIIFLAGLIWLLAFFLINYYRKTVLRFARDILTRNKLLEALNTELYNTNAELDSFVYAASHQLSGPMKSIKGLVTTFDKGNNDLPLEVFLEMLQTAIVKIDANFQSIIFHSENRSSDVVTTEFRFEQLLNEVLRIIDSEMDIHDIGIVTDFEACPMVYTDQNRLKVILICLLSNAVQYQNTGGKPKSITIRCINTENAFTLEIDDNGIGIPKENLASVTEMFVKLNHNSSGPGLGLYIVSEILKKLSGTLSIASVQGQGTHVTVTIPI